MITPHDREIIGEIDDCNMVEVVAAAYTVYEQMCTKKPISKREFFNEFEDNSWVNSGTGSSTVQLSGYWN